MISLFFYKVYGLTAVSQIHIADLEKTKTPQGNIQDADVRIIVDDVSPGFADNQDTVRMSEHFYFLALPERFSMHCNGFDFEISGGNQIRISQNAFNAEETHLSTYILGSAFGVLCMQRGFTPVHGAAVRTNNGGAAIITGYAGSGKSAILGALVGMGYKYLADDVSVVAFKDANPVVLPAYPQRKIAYQPTEEMDAGMAGGVLINEDGREKLAIRETGEWADNEAQLGSIIELVPAKREDGAYYTPEVRRITGHASLSIILRNLYRRRFWENIGVTPERMKQLLFLASTARIYQLRRPYEGFPVEETARLIEEGCLIQEGPSESTS